MKKRRIDQFKAELDLTSMLDVIFIILLVVLCQLRLLAVSDQESITMLKKELSEADKAAQIYETQLQSIENAETKVVFFTLFADFESGDPKTRHLRLLRSGETKIEDLVIRPENEEEVFASFEEQMRTYLVEYDGMPVLLTLDEEQILYRDQLFLTTLFDTLTTDYPNLFLQSRED